MKTKVKRADTLKGGHRTRRGGVVLTVRQAELLVGLADAVVRHFGLTPMERLLVGAVRRRVWAANGRE
jgi:hypothetical protein